MTPALAAMLAGLRPQLRGAVYVYCPWPEGQAFPEGGLALVREDEGLCAILPETAAAALGLVPAPFRGACLSLHLQSDLAAVGLTAALSTALAEAGLSANVIAGLYHDHILVPWAARDQALAILTALSAKVAAP